MTDDLRTGTECPLDGAPTWVRIVQAGLIGLVAGLALHLLLSMVVLQGREAKPASTAPSECRKSSPVKAPQLKAPTSTRPVA